MEETLSLVRAEATALDNRLRAEQKAKEAAREQARAHRRASLNAATSSSSSLDGRGASVPPSSGGGRGSSARSASAGRASSVTRGATAPKIVAWRGGTQVKEIDSSSVDRSTDNSRGRGGGAVHNKSATTTATTKPWGLFGNKGTPKKPADIAPVSGAIEAAIKAAQAADTQGSDNPNSPTSQLKRPVLKRPGSREGNNKNDSGAVKTSGDTSRNPMLRSESPLANASAASDDEVTPMSSQLSTIQAKKEAKAQEAVKAPPAAGGPAVRPKAPSTFSLKGRTKAL